MKKKYLIPLLLIILLVPVIALNIRCAVEIQDLSQKSAVLKEHYADANSIAYGLLSVDEWMGHIKKIASDRIQDFKFTKSEEDSLKAEIITLFTALFSKTDSVIQHEHKTFKEKLRKLVVNAFVDKKKLQKKIPDYAQTIINELKKPANRKKLNYIIQAKLDEYAHETYSTLNDKASLDSLLLQYKAKDLNSFNRLSKLWLYIDKDSIYKRSFIMIASMIFFLLLWFLLRNQPEAHPVFFVLSVALALVILYTGLTSPMIEIDARINNIDFYLIGEHIQFNDQVLFFRSKSIVEVVRVLIETHKTDSVIVGFLLLTFSIIFPIAKLLSTEFYLLGSEKMKRNRFVYFFAFRSSKWSMADVMVVAIFMAYIGFKGILDSQLGDLNVQTPTYTTIATNHTSLQPGFILFTAFVLYSLILSEILKKIVPGKEERIRRAARHPLKKPET